jgi:hypothetical protein
MNQKRTYDSTVARIAGNIASGFVSDPAVSWPMDAGAAKVLAKSFVMLAREIIAETERTEPLPMPPIPQEADRG